MPLIPQSMALSSRSTANSQCNATAKTLKYRLCVTFESIFLLDCIYIACFLLCYLANWYRNLPAVCLSV